MTPDPLLAVWFAFVFIAEPIEHASHHRLVEKSAEVHAGMQPSQVTSILGTPNAKYAKRSVFASWWLDGPRPKQWMYGTSFNLDYVLIPHCPWINPLPTNIRIFDYADEDLIIDWTDDDRVVFVHRPDFSVPKIAFDILDVSLFSRDVLQQFVFHSNPKPVNGG